MKKLLFVVIVLFLASCDYQVKRCTYEVYQHGKKLPGTYVKYIDRPKWCESYSKGGVVYKLKDVDLVKVRDIKK